MSGLAPGQQIELNFSPTEGQSPQTGRASSVGVCLWCKAKFNKVTSKKFCCNRCLRKAEYARNKDKIVARSKKRYWSNREKEKAERRARYYANHEQEKSNKRAHWAENRERHRARLKKFYRDKYAELRGLVLQKYGSKCAQCSESRWQVLQLDHVNGDGAKERRKTASFTILNNALADKDGRYQLLCANCNWMKRYERREYTTGDQAKPPPSCQGGGVLIQARSTS